MLFTWETLISHEIQLFCFRFLRSRLLQLRSRSRALVPPRLPSQSPPRSGLGPGHCRRIRALRTSRLRPRPETWGPPPHTRATGSENSPARRLHRWMTSCPPVQTLGRSPPRVSYLSGAGFVVHCDRYGAHCLRNLLNDLV